MPERQVVAKELAEIFKIIAHPDRIRIIEELGSGEKDVNTLVECLDLVLMALVLILTVFVDLITAVAAGVGHQVRERVKHKTTAIILDFTRVPFVDVSAARAVETVIRDAHDAGKIVYETGMNKEVRDTLVGLNSIRNLPVDVSYLTRVEALRAAVDLIQSKRDGGLSNMGEPNPATS